LTPYDPRLEPIADRHHDKFVDTVKPAEFVDAPGMKGLRHAEVLGHLEGAVMAQHHAARSDTDILGLGGHVPDQDFGR
jgi:hypothetical protein